MKKVELYCKGGHQAPGIYNVSESDVPELLKMEAWCKPEDMGKQIINEIPIEEKEIEKITKEELFSWTKKEQEDKLKELGREIPKYEKDRVILLYNLLNE